MLNTKGQKAPRPRQLCVPRLPPLPSLLALSPPLLSLNYVRLPFRKFQCAIQFELGCRWATLAAVATTNHERRRNDDDDDHDRPSQASIHWTSHPSRQPAVQLTALSCICVSGRFALATLPTFDLCLAASYFIAFFAFRFLVFSCFLNTRYL